jgi:hypothetical protein
MTRIYDRRDILAKRRKERQRARFIRDIASDGLALAALVIIGVGLMGLAVGFGWDAVL